jgi:hypothetical protein
MMNDGASSMKYATAQEGLTIHVDSQTLISTDAVKLGVEEIKYEHMYFGAYLTPAQALEVASALIHEAAEITRKGKQ